MSLRLASGFVLAVTLLVPRFATAAELPASKPEVRKAIVATIEAQLAAFRKRDLTKAYSYAAAELRAEKPLPVFMTIVQTNYPEIWANIKAEYGIVRDDGEHAILLVHVFAPQCDASYDYNLVREQGGWRIHDVLRHETAKSAGKI
jgi:hypothetical protein